MLPSPAVQLARVYGEGRHLFDTTAIKTPKGQEPIPVVEL